VTGCYIEVNTGPILPTRRDLVGSRLELAHSSAMSLRQSAVRNGTCLLIAAWHTSAFAGAATSPPATASRVATPAYLRASVEEFRQLLSLPNDAHFTAQIERNMAFMETAFARRRFSVERLPTDGPPVLVARRPATNAGRTVLIYLQLDGQPVAGKWSQADPYTPELKALEKGEWRSIPFSRLAHAQIDPEWRIFARSASDAKGPAAMFLTALDLFDAAGSPQQYDIKVVMDFEEEIGSPNLPAAVRRHADKLAADMLLIFDGPMHISNRPTLDFGARGIIDVELTVFGPRVPQHSGHYGNYVPNPALMLSQLLGGMKDEHGRVTLPGFYDGIALDDATRRILADTGDDEAEMKRSLGIAATDRVAATYQEAIQYPSLNIRGLSAGWTGLQARTIIPASADAILDIRLVPESDPDRLIGLIESYIKDRGYHVIGNRSPTEEERQSYPRIASLTHTVAYRAFRTEYGTQVGRWLNRTLEKTFGAPPVRIRQGGGSIPIAPFVVELGLPAVAVPTVNIDNNQHSPDENIRLGNYIDGIRTFLAILSEPIEDPEGRRAGTGMDAPAAVSGPTSPP
jgi:acetylornithine deacetylase/succinyl-diaminopimelate desuccinylase-like protein